MFYKFLVTTVPTHNASCNRHNVLCKLLVKALSVMMWRSKETHIIFQRVKKGCNNLSIIQMHQIEY